jgi:hypothetical protein
MQFAACYEQITEENKVSKGETSSFGKAVLQDTVIPESLGSPRDFNPPRRATKERNLCRPATAG